LSQKKRKPTSPDAAKFRVFFTEIARQSYSKLDGSIKPSIRKAIEEKLAVAPDHYGDPLSGALSGYWKYRHPSHRIIYTIEKDTLIVIVCAIGSRKASDYNDIYAWFARMVESGKVFEQVLHVLEQLRKK
jgi:mRNA-degrading endonuclease RelE of RelBE toxin-antitoxin system